jgi:hypothetical protein
MALVAWGLLLGAVGLVWVLVINVTQSDHQTKKQSARESDRPIAESVRRESKAA